MNTNVDYHNQSTIASTSCINSLILLPSLTEQDRCLLVGGTKTFSLPSICLWTPAFYFLTSPLFSCLFPNLSSIPHLCFFSKIFHNKPCTIP